MADGDDGIGVRLWPVDQRGGAHNVAETVCVVAFRAENLIPIQFTQFDF